MIPLSAITVFAASSVVAIECGDGVSCIIDSSAKTATFNGSGKISPTYQWVINNYTEYYDVRDTVEKIYLSEGITEVYSGAFAIFSNTKEIHISSTVNNIMVRAFMHPNYTERGMDELSSIHVNENNSYYSSKDGVLYNKGQTELVVFPIGKDTRYIVPNGVTSIGSNAFAFANELTHITLPETVIEINDGAFQYCRSLLQIVMPSRCTKIGRQAFLGCSSLESLSIPEGVTNVYENSLEGCKNLKTISLPSSLKSIGNYAFSGCLSLGKVELPESVTSIGVDAFKNCDSLENFTIPKNVSLVNYYDYGYNPCPDCDSLINVFVDEENENFTSVDGVLFNKEKTELIAFPAGRSGVTTIADGTKVIGASAFSGAKCLSNISLPNSLEIIGGNAFEYCTFDTIKIPDSVKIIEWGAFVYNEFKKITIPNSVEMFGSGSFNACDNLEEITILNSSCLIKSDFCLNQNVIVKGHKGSTAEQAAKKYGKTFINIDTYDDYYEDVGEIAVVTRNKNGTTISGCTITVGDKEYVAESHTLFIDVPDDYSGEITVSKDGYITSSLPVEMLKKYNFFVMYPDTETAPITQHYLLRDANSSGNGYVDLLRSSEYIYDLGNQKHDIYIDVNSNGHTVKSIYLLQGKQKVILTNGMNYNINSNGLFNSDGGTIYLCIETSDGTIYKTDSRIVAAKTRVTLDADIQGSVSGIVDEELSAVGGWSYTGKFKLGDLPVSITIEENKVKGTIGIKGSEQSTATWYEAISGTIKKHEDLYGDEEYDSETIEELEKSLKDSGGDIVEGYSSFGIDVSGSIIGYIEANWNPVTCKLENIQIGMILKIAGEASYTQQSSFVVVSVPIPYYWTVEFGLELAAQINGKWEYGVNDKVDFSVEMPELSVGAELTGSLCLGLDKIVGGGGKVKGGLTVTFKAPDYSFTTSVWELSYEIALTGQLAGFSGDLNLKDGTYQIYPQNETQTTTLVTENLMSSYAQNNKLMVSAYSLRNSTYNNAGEEGGSVYTFKSNGYTYSSPSVAVLSDGTAVMVWVDYDNERANINKTALFYSVYSPEQGDWSDPQQVENDGTPDDFPVLKVFDNKIYLVWNDADKALAEDATFLDMLSGMGISYAVFNGSTFTSVSSVSGQNDYMDVCADIAIVNNTPTVVWIKNQENDIFGQNGLNSIMVAKFTNNTWDERNAVDTYSPINSVTIVDENGIEAIYYSADADHTTDTFDDYEIFTLYNDEQIQTSNNEHMDTSLLSSGGIAYWVGNGQIASSYGEVIDCKGIGNEYIVVEDNLGYRAIIYTVSDADGNTEYMLCKETDNGFSSPVLLTSGKHISGGISAYYNDDTLLLITNEIDAGTLASLIKVYEFNNQPDLLIEKVYYDQYTLMEGGELRATITLKNNGCESVDGYILRAYANDELLLEKEMQNILLPGQKSDDEIHIGLPSNIDFNQIKFFVEFLHRGVSLVSEPYLLSLSLQDISLENAIIVSDNDTANLSVSVVNRGISELSDLIVYLRADSENGEIIDSYNISQISSREEVVVQFDVGEYVTDKTRFYVTTDVLENEKNVANNSDFAVCTEFLENEIIIENVFDLYESININETKTFVIDDESATSVIIFQPTDDGTYNFNFSSAFYSNSVVKDANGNELDSQYGYSYDMGCELVGGNIYYIETKPYWDDYGEYTVFVEKLEHATAISIDAGENYSGYVNTDLYLNIVFSPENAIEEEIVWTTNDPQIVSVDEYGYVRLLQEGTAIITATSENGLTASCSITVMSIPTIIEDEDVTVDLNQNDPYAYFYFTPEEDGYYVFYSESNNDTYGYIFDANLNQLNSDDDSGDGSNFRVGYQMEAGTTYILQARFYSKSTNGSFNVIIKKSKFITNLEITSLPTKMEYIKGFVDLKYDGLQLKATWSDGTTTDWVMNVDDYYIGDQRVHIYDDDADVNGNITISCGGKEVSYTLTLVDNPVDHIEVVSGTSFKCIENYNGCIDENDDGEYFQYYVKYPSDAVIRIVYKDGTSVTANVGSYVEDFYVSWDSNQYNEPWVVGSENKSIITYLGHSVYLPITVEKNWVESIEVVSGKVTCIENAYGHEISNGFLYYYDMPDDVTLKVNYLDGSSKVVNIKDKVDGYSFDFYEDQYSKPWVLGEDNYITLSYLGAETQLPVSVIANPVERIEINTAPTREYIYGDIKYGEFDGNSYGLFYPSDLTGLSFTVYYTDGSNKTFSYEDIDEDGKINGYGYYLNRDDSVPEIGDFSVQFEYMGRTAEYTVVLKETNVSSISVTKVPEKNRFNEPNFVGMEIAISYKDGTSKTVTVTDDNLSYGYNYHWAEFYHYVTIDDSVLRIVKYGYDNPYWYAVYLGATCEIRDLSFEDSKDINSIELKIDSWIGYGMIAEVKYADGTTETLTIEMLDYFFSSYESIADCYGKTEDGIIHYTIKVFTDQDGNEIRYEVSLLGETISVEAKKALAGDVTGDGVVNNKDVTLLRRYLIGGWDVTIDSDAADVNKDGDINNKDVTLLRRYLIGGWNVTLG